MVNLLFVVVGYGDGIVRMFDINKEEMVFKMYFYVVLVIVISFFLDGQFININYRLIEKRYNFLNLFRGQNICIK